MRPRIVWITRVTLTITALTCASVAFLNQGSILLYQGGGDSGEGLSSVALARPLLASNGNEGGDKKDKKDKPEKAPKPAQSSQPRPPRAEEPPPSPPSDEGPCQFVLGFAELHRILAGRDGTCLTNEFDDPNGTGDRLQLTSLPRPNGLMVWNRYTNSMRWTDGKDTVTYSKCLLQERSNSETFAWELNPNLLLPESAPVPPGACDVMPRLAGEAALVAGGASGGR